MRKLGDSWGDFEQVEEYYARYDCNETVPEDVEEVEKVKSME
ncbi:hypothetical protein PC129_g17938 [Phytophthora cactorum]|uniref:Uncharacterized protein n=1 Tax=Phytophthora cactorum TaxID=29920 RepID=A0A329RQI8_9STRA|nr:hypothetical protein Pcac1_g17785 [Phytophthora cactorum]KAG2804021.1 hypothetical protein PC111_g18437 [Phytophthora cactorum]KAG2804505.1 hypothetical protein PC112_g18688 [Phytophthora cactorum]KAG2840240.1 hypothetical protein PC113_g19303 [Phytophthora cactorum]KAG2893972.1 hypothetical protein PC114_g16060 [Phytophthora cactorum]